MITSDPRIHDCDRHGEDLLARISELTKDLEFEADGWRVLLANAAARIRELESRVYQLEHTVAYHERRYA